MSARYRRAYRDALHAIEREAAPLTRIRLPQAPRSPLPWRDLLAALLMLALFAAACWLATCDPWLLADAID